MSWVCSNCSTSNDERSTHCAVCGYARPPKPPVAAKRPAPVEGKVVFSGFAVITESVKNVFRSVARIGAKLKPSEKPRRTRKSREEKRTGPEPKEKKKKALRKEKTPVGKTPAEKTGFAEPWPEHNIRFDYGVIKGRGFVRSERTEIKTVKGYTFYKSDGSSQFIKSEMLVVLRMAIRL